MTITELRNHPEYTVCFDRIKSYRPGFTFTLNYEQIPRAKGNALKIIMQDAIEQGLLESVAIGLALDGTMTDETFRKKG